MNCAIKLVASAQDLRTLIPNAAYALMDMFQRGMELIPFAINAMELAKLVQG